MAKKTVLAARRSMSRRHAARQCSPRPIFKQAASPEANRITTGGGGTVWDELAMMLWRPGDYELKRSR